MKSFDAESLRKELASLYSDESKHSSYQSIPGFVADAVGYQVKINEDWRGDRVRLNYILSRLAGRGYRRWGDFGANTGFFSLTLAHEDAARRVLAIEANPNHADFIRRIAGAFNLSNLEILGRPIALEDLDSIQRQDVLLHLNVLHHAGADFDKGLVAGPDDFLAYAQSYLERLHGCARILVLQVGTNLWGDKSKPIIDYREDAAKYAMFSSLLTRSGWRIEDVAYPMRREGQPVVYESLFGAATDVHARSINEPPQAAFGRFDLSRHIGEFYRRPLFICSSLLQSP